jgi:predicted MFS family arabinose efflux permease
MDETAGLGDVRAPRTSSAGRAGGAHWGVFAVLCGAYFVTTTGEQMLSPLFPTVADDLGLSVTQGGIAFAVLTGSIAVTNLLGGAGLRRHEPITLVRLAAVAGLAGSVVNALSHDYATLLAGQALLGVAAGLFFPAGLQGVGLAAGPAKRGFAMGIYGVAFSLGLTAAAALGAIGAGVGWRTPFWIAGALFVAAGVTTIWTDLGPRDTSGDEKVPWRQVLSLPTYVGIVLAVLQYGAIPFLTTYAVDHWGISAAAAATVLIVGRLISIVAKVIGGASADRIGAKASARRTAVVLAATGLAWVLLPGNIATYAIAAVFAGTVSSLGPVANILAVERFGQNGMALGMYRSLQIALGAAASAVVGVAAGIVGLRPTLAVAALVPLTLIWICRDGARDHIPSAKPTVRGSAAASQASPGDGTRTT